jgi:hypothetical protein
MNGFARRLIIFLIRRRLGVRCYHPFQFDDQLDDSWYYFTRTHLMKITGDGTRQSNLSLMYVMYASVKTKK